MATSISAALLEFSASRIPARMKAGGAVALETVAVKVEITRTPRAAMAQPATPTAALAEAEEVQLPVYVMAMVALVPQATSSSSGCSDALRNEEQKRRSRELHRVGR